MNTDGEQLCNNFTSSSWHCSTKAVKVNILQSHTAFVCFSLVQTWLQKHDVQLPVSKLHHLGSLTQKRHWWLRETGDNTTQMIQEHNVGVQKFLQYLGHLFDGCGGFAREGLWWQCSSYLVFQKTLNWDCVIYHHWRNIKPSDERLSWILWSKKS